MKENFAVTLVIFFVLLRKEIILLRYDFFSPFLLKRKVIQKKSPNSLFCLASVLFQRPTKNLNRTKPGTRCFRKFPEPIAITHDRENPSANPVTAITERT